MNRLSTTLPVPNGATIAPRSFQLGGGRVPIRTISVHNGSTLTVLIYFGLSPNGVPLTVLPKKSITASQEGTFGCYIAFAGVATADGFVYVSLTEREAAMFTAEGVT